MPQPRPDTDDERAIPNRHIGGIDRWQATGADCLGHLERDRSGADREGGLAPVCDQRLPGVSSLAYGVLVRLVEVTPDQHDLSAEPTHPTHLDRVGLPIDEDGDRNPMCSTRIRDRLSEVPTRGDDDAALLVGFTAGDELVHGEPRASTLEGSNRVDRLHLDDGRVSDSLGEPVGLELGGVEKNRIDQ